MDREPQAPRRHLLPTGIAGLDTILGEASGKPHSTSSLAGRARARPRLHIN